MRVAEVEVGLDEVLVDLEDRLARQDNLLDSPVDPERELVRTEKFTTYLYAVHSYQDSVAKPREQRSHRDRSRPAPWGPPDLPIEACGRGRSGLMPRKTTNSSVGAR